MWRTKNGENILKDGRTLIMGIVNVSEDSFYDGKNVTTLENTIRHAGQLLEDGADILDVGGVSTRPGAEPIATETERARVIPVVREIRKRFPRALVSLDTSNASVAENGIDEGVDIINEVTGLRGDTRMASVCAENDMPVILMHIQGTPQTMQENPHYDDVVREVGDFFETQMAYAQSQGIDRERIMLDPGIGFGKLISHNIALIRASETFKQRLCRPILIGASRKRMIGDITGLPVDDRLFGTIGAHLAASLFGANVIRVHDVRAHTEALAVFSEIHKRSYSLHEVPNV